MHIHSCYSDGIFTPSEIVQKVIESGLGGFSITDHDSFDGIEETLLAIKNREEKIYFVPGCEFSTNFDGIGEIHVLGYFRDSSFIKMKELINSLKASRLERALRILDCLKMHGIKIELSEITHGKNIPIGRMHIARHLVQLGYSKDTSSAFEKFLKRDGLCYFSRDNISIEEAIKYIKAHNGIAVVAHPTFLYVMQNWNYVDKIIALGIDGIEYKHPKISDELSRKIKEEMGSHLLLTGGSDFHGDGPKDYIGKYSVSLETIRSYLG